MPTSFWEGCVFSGAQLVCLTLPRLPGPHVLLVASHFLPSVCLHPVTGEVKQPLSVLNVWRGFSTCSLNERVPRPLFSWSARRLSLWLFLLVYRVHPPEVTCLLLRCSGPSNYSSSPFWPSRPSYCLQERSPAPWWALYLGCQELFWICLRIEVFLKWRKTAWCGMYYTQCAFHLRKQVHLWFSILNVSCDFHSPLWINCYQSISLFSLENRFLHLIWKGSMGD